MEKKLQKLIDRAVKKWDKLKATEVSKKESYQRETTVLSKIGFTTAWDNPDILWLMENIDGGVYEESGSQVGLTKDGRIVWEYQSHCSCNGFGDSAGTGYGVLTCGIDTTKSYELNSLPKDWEKIIKVNLEILLS